MKEEEFEAEIRRRLTKIEAEIRVKQHNKKKMRYKYYLSLGLLFLLSGGVYLLAEEVAIPTKFRDGQLLTQASLNLMRDKINEHHMARVPLRGIIAWHKDFPGQPPELPNGYVECNGQEITVEDSPFQGLHAPNLNGVTGPGNENSPGMSKPERLFLRGGETSGDGETDALQMHGHDNVAHAHGTRTKTRLRGNDTPTLPNIEYVLPSVTTEIVNRTVTGGVSDVTVQPETISITNPNGPGVITDSEETRPKSMSVIWIMRVK